MNSATTAKPIYSFAPIRQCGASEAGNAAIGTKALSAYEMIVPLANMIVRASGSSWRCVEAHEQRSIRETLSSN